MLIRPADLTDIQAIMRLIAEVVPDMLASGNYQWDDKYPNPQVFEKDIDLNQLWVADMQGDIAGVIAITHDQSPEYADAGWDVTLPAIVTHRLAVSPRYQGRGIAAALLQKAEAEAIRQGIHILRIDTNTNNKATQQLFPKLGYVYAGQISLAFREGLRFACFEKVL